MIHPSATIGSTARVHPDAVIGAGCRIGEFCVIEQDVTIGANCTFEPHCYVKRWTTMGDSNAVSAGTVLGSDPLDKNFTGERSYLRLGNGNRIREHYTISRGTKPESATVIGNDNYIMTSGHIAHNCSIGDGNVIASCALIAGYVEIEDRAFLSGGVLVHQFGRIGRLAMVSGNARANLDLPPFFTYVGEKVRPNGLNLVGLRRAGFTATEIANLKKAYRILFRSGLKLADALEKIERETPDQNTLHLVAFIRASKRGICRERSSRSLPDGIHACNN